MTLSQDLQAEPTAAAAAVPVVHDTIDPVLDALRGENRKRKARQQRIVAAIVVATLVFALVAAKTPHFASFIGMFTSFTGVAYAATARQKQLTKSLAGCDDVRAVPAFLDALGFNDAGLRTVAIEQLTVLLPRVQASDAGIFGPSHRKALSSLLGQWLFTDRAQARSGRTRVSARMRARFCSRTAALQDERLAVGLLASLGQVGDRSNLAAVTAVANDARSADVRDAAVAARELIAAHTELRQGTTTLLRASGAPEDTGATLVRAAGGQSAVPAEELLRPGQGNA